MTGTGNEDEELLTIDVADEAWSGVCASIQSRTEDEKWWPAGMRSLEAAASGRDIDRGTVEEFHVGFARPEKRLIGHRLLKSRTKEYYCVMMSL